MGKDLAHFMLVTLQFQRWVSQVHLSMFNAWDSTSNVLTLGGNVTVNNQSGLLVSTPQLVIPNLTSFDNIERTIQESTPIPKGGQLGGRLYFQGPCQVKVNAPYDVNIENFLGLSKGHKLLLSVIGGVLCFIRRFWQSPSCEVTIHEPTVHNCPKIFGYEKYTCTGRDICVDTKGGMHMDMRQGHISFNGPLAVSWAEKEVRLSAGGAEILLRDGACILHHQVDARMGKLKLKASKLTWFARQNIVGDSLVTDDYRTLISSNLHDPPTTSIRISCTIRDKHELDKTKGRPERLPDSPLLGESFKDLIQGSGLDCQWTSGPKPTSVVYSGLKELTRGDNKFRKVIPVKDKGFPSFWGIGQLYLCGFFSACKVSLISETFSSVLNPGSRSFHRRFGGKTRYLKIFGAECAKDNTSLSIFDCN